MADSISAERDALDVPCGRRRSVYRRSAETQRGKTRAEAPRESIIGLFETEVIRRKNPLRHLEVVEFATLGCVDMMQSPAVARADWPRYPRPSKKHATMRRLPSLESHALAPRSIARTDIHR